MATVAALTLTQVVGIGVGVAAVGMTASVLEQRKGRKDAARAEAIRQKSNRLQSARSAVEGVRAAQVARASVVQQGENQGVAGSSSVLGGAGGIKSRAGGNVGFAQTIFSLQQSQARLMKSASGHFANASDIGAVTNFATSSIGGYAATRT